jgi:hypothetical protein
VVEQPPIRHSQRLPGRLVLDELRREEQRTKQIIRELEKARKMLADGTANCATVAALYESLRAAEPSKRERAKRYRAIRQDMKAIRVALQVEARAQGATSQKTAIGEVGVDPATGKYRRKLSGRTLKRALATLAKYRKSPRG